jgi:hypothetical protein
MCSSAMSVFGRDLHRELDVPIGLIETCWGGTVCEAWTGARALAWVTSYSILSPLPITNRKFVRADAVIDGTTVLVSSPAVDKPVAVRYGWDANPTCNLSNKQNLPAVPFRTDDWPGVTRKH